MLHLYSARPFNRVVIGLLALLFLSPQAAGAVDTLTVFAAASSTNAISEIGQLFSARQPVKIVPSFAASSTLAKQIEDGAPADLFLSADSQWMDYLEQRQRVAPGSRVDLLGNRLVLIAPADSPAVPIEIAPGVSLAAILGEGRLAMGDPDHVPVGIYGKQAMEKLGAWEGVKGKLAPTSDVRASLALVERGECPLGLVYATDAAISKKVKVVGRFPEHSHPPVVYPAALVVGRDSAAARRFLDFLKSPDARLIFEKYGFSVR